jgi:nucleotide sugar dehydrogenase
MIKNKVTIIGLGYVGLPLVCSIAKNKKYKCCGFDTDKAKVRQIAEKICPIGDKKTAADLRIVKIEVSTSPLIVKDSEYIIICVPTPVKNNKIPNLKPIILAAETIGKYLEKGQKIILESTVNPGVCEEVILPILEKTGLKGGKDFELSHCPERINPGDPKWNVENIPRNIGSLTKNGNKKVADFYRSFIKAPINEVSTLKIAEASKIIENTFRDINIAYVNELAKSFDLMNIDLLEVIKAASNKPFAFLPHYPGCGVGGHCIPVDPYYLIKRAKDLGFDHSFLRNARKVNNSMPNYTVDLMEDKLKEIGRKISNTNIALLGLSYKANVGDLRESPSLKILDLLKKLKAPVKVFDPYVLDKSNVKSLAEILKISEAVIIGIDHSEFRKIDGKMLKKYKIKIVIDGKNILDKGDIEKAGILYKGIGH